MKYKFSFLLSDNTNWLKWLKFEVLRTFFSTIILPTHSRKFPTQAKKLDKKTIASWPDFNQVRNTYFTHSAFETIFPLIRFKSPHLMKYFLKKFLPFQTCFNIKIRHFLRGLKNVGKSNKVTVCTATSARNSFSNFGADGSNKISAYHWVLHFSFLK